MLFEYIMQRYDSHLGFFLLLCSLCIIDVILIQLLPFETKDILLSSDFKEAEVQKVRYGTMARRPKSSLPS